MTKESKHYTAFNSRLYEFNFWPFGLVNACYIQKNDQIFAQRSSKCIHLHGWHVHSYCLFWWTSWHTFTSLWENKKCWFNYQTFKSRTSSENHQLFMSYFMVLFLLIIIKLWLKSYRFKLQEPKKQGKSSLGLIKYYSKFTSNFSEETTVFWPLKKRN